MRGILVLVSFRVGFLIKVSFRVGRAKDGSFFFDLLGSFWVRLECYVRLFFRFRGYRVAFLKLNVFYRYVLR